MMRTVASVATTHTITIPVADRLQLRSRMHARAFTLTTAIILRCHSDGLFILFSLYSGITATVSLHVYLILRCHSDGLWDFCTAQKAAEVARRSGTPQKAARRLVELAWQRSHAKHRCRGTSGRRTHSYANALQVL